MAEVNRLVERHELKTDLLSSLINDASMQPQLFYGADADILRITFTTTSGPLVVHYVDEFVGFLYQADTMEIVGFHIEDFEAAFMPKYSQLETAWQEPTPEIRDFGDVIAAFEREKPKVVKEVVKATGPRLGATGHKLITALG